MQYYWKEAVRRLWLPVLFFALLWAIPVLAEQAQDAPKEVTLIETVKPDAIQSTDIVGVWHGNFKRQDQYGKIWFEESVVLEIRENPLKGEFSSEKGRRWKSEVKIVKDDKVIMYFDRSEREFTLTRRNGDLLLETRYEETWQGWPRVNAALFKKARAQ